MDNKSLLSKKFDQGDGEDDSDGDDFEPMDSEEITIDYLLNKIGYTWYHLLIYIITAFTLISDGSIIYTMYLLSPVIKREYKFSTLTKAFMVSSLFIGFAIGSLFCGYFTKKFMRKWPVVISLLIVIFFGIISVLINNVWYFIVCQFIVGLGIGILINFVNSLFEILPSKFRDFLMGSIYIHLRIGTLMLCLIVYALMDDSKGYLETKNWKICFVLGFSPNIFALILMLFFYQESPRLFLWENQVEKGIIELERLAKMNDKVITEYEKKSLILYILKKKKR